MAECGKQVGQGIVAYPCIIEVEDGPHAGPCAARENIRSMNERAKWDEARERAAKSGVPTLEELGMQGTPKTVIEGLLDRGSGEGRRIHPDEQQRIKDGMDTSRTEEASLETRLVQTAGAVDLSGVGLALSNLPEQISKIIEASDGIARQDTPTGSLGAAEQFQHAQAPKWELKILGETDQPLPRTVSELNVQDLVIEDIAERKALGIERYGEPLHPFNGRNSIRDAYEEGLDLAVYLRQVSLEHDAAALALYELGGLLDEHFGGDTPSEIQSLLAQIVSALS